MTKTWPQQLFTFVPSHMWDTLHITPKSKEEEVALEGHDIFEWEEKQIFSFVACFCNGKIASKCGFEMHLSDALSFPLRDYILDT